MRISLACRPAFDYGRQTHDTLIEANGATFKSRSLTLALSAAVPLRNDGRGGVSAEFVLSEGKSQVFILRDDCNEGAVPCPPSEKEAEELLRGTVKFWQNWLSACTYHGRWRDQVHRSALALKLLTFEPTGAIIAAPTTSLPEVIGGARNWDYRYTWMRDAAFTVYAFLRIGFRDEAAAFMGWIEDYASKHVTARRRAARSSSRSRATASFPSRRWITGKAIEGPVRCASATMPFRSSRETSTANSWTRFTCPTSTSAPPHTTFG